MKSYVLTQVFRQEADTVFTSGLASELWMELGIALGFAEAAVVATTSIATGTPSGEGFGNFLFALPVSGGVAVSAAPSFMPYLMFGATVLAAAIVLLFGPIGISSYGVGQTLHALGRETAWEEPPPRSSPCRDDFGFPEGIVFSADFCDI